MKKTFPLLLFFLLLFFYDVAFLNKTLSSAPLLSGTTPQGPYGYSGSRPDMPFTFDTAGNAWINEPNPYIVKRVVKNGILPAWDPYEGLGIPLTGNLNTEVFNPLKIFLNLFPHPFLQDMFFLLRLLVAGIFTYLFLRETKLSQASSLFGASFFMLSGYSVWWINLHPLSTVMYLPAVFYFYERWSGKRELKSAFFLSLFVAFAFLGGKTPDVIMALCLLFPYALWKGILKDSLRGLFREGTRITIAFCSGVLMASIALLPFLELYVHASPLAKAIRTGAAGHTVPLITSVTLLQPLFLGWENYFYGSWLKWIPQIMLPHASIVIILFAFYSVISRSTVKRVLPFFLFSSLMFLLVYGFIPAQYISKLPVLGSIEFLKYNAMFYFSLAVMSAIAFEELLSDKERRISFYSSVILVSLLLLSFFFFLYGQAPQEMKGIMVAVLCSSLAGLIITTVVYRFSKNRQLFGGLVFFFLLLELFLYMPKDHPERVNPYKKPQYFTVFKERDISRITGSQQCIPPLVSNAVGLYDMRAISVLMPGDYYLFSENLLGFSIPYTNNPNPLFTATAPSADLLGVRYILSHERLDSWVLEDEIRTHVASMKWIRLFDSMVSHTIQGRTVYGFHEAGNEKRFSFFFPMSFRFQTKIRVSQPFLFAGFSLKDVPQIKQETLVKVKIDNEINNISISREQGWQDLWIDISRYLGNVVTVTVESEKAGEGQIVLGNFGLSPGYEREAEIIGKLLPLHRAELPLLTYRGEYEGIHIYENTNAMERAFVLHDIKRAESLDAIIQSLQQGSNFRDIALLSDISHDMEERIPALSSKENKIASSLKNEKIIIKEYLPNRIVLDVYSNGGILVLSDLFYPGWKVRVNGRDEEVVKVFGVLRGVLLGDGENEVVFYYRPMSFYAGIIISATTFLLWFLFLHFQRRKAVE